MTGPHEGAPRTKPYVLRPGDSVAAKLMKAMAKALVDLELNPPIGSPTMGRVLSIDELRTWRLQGFSLTF